MILHEIVKQIVSYINFISQTNLFYLFLRVLYSSSKRRLPWTWSLTMASTLFWIRRKVYSSRERSILLTIIRETCQLQVRKLLLRQWARPISVMPSLPGHSMRRYTRRDQIIHNDSRQVLLETNWKSSSTAMERSLMVMTEEHRALPLASRRTVMFYRPHKRWRTTISTSIRKLTEISNQTTLWLVHQAITNMTFLTITIMFSKIRVTAFMISWRRRRILALPSRRPLTRLLLALVAPEEVPVAVTDQHTLIVELAVRFKRNRAIPAYQRDQDPKDLMEELEELVDSKTRLAPNQEEKMI